MLKLFKLAIVASFLGLALSAELASLKQCGQANPYIEYLTTKGVKLISAPQIDTATCKGEWSTYGTCCDKESLLSFAKADRQSVIVAVQAIKSFSAHTLSSYTSMSTEFLAAARKTTRKLPLWSAQLKEKYDAGYFKMLDLLAEKMANGSAFNTSLDHCWDHMSSIRSKTLCSTCSGRSALFFNETKGIIDTPVCALTLETCLPSFKFLLTFLTEIDKLLGSLYQPVVTKSNQPQPTSSKTLAAQLAVKQLSETAGLIKQSEIMSAIEDFLSQGAKDPLKAAKICGILMKLSHETFVESIFKELQAIDPVLQYFIKRMRRTVSKFSNSAAAAQTVSNHKTRRLLFGHHFSHGLPLLEGDVMVMPPPFAGIKKGLHFSSQQVVSNFVQPQFGKSPINFDVSFP